MRANFIYNKRLTNHLIMETYIRGGSLSDDDNVQYVVDCEGNLHDLSGNVDAKLESVNYSRRYWEGKLRANPNDTMAKKFYDKFAHLYQQITILIENNQLLAEA